jgi:hypothetical protein
MSVKESALRTLDRLYINETGEYCYIYTQILINNILYKIFDNPDKYKKLIIFPKLYKSIKDELLLYLDQYVSIIYILATKFLFDNCISIKYLQNKFRKFKINTLLEIEIVCLKILDFDLFSYLNLADITYNINKCLYYQLPLLKDIDTKYYPPYKQLTANMIYMIDNDKNYILSKHKNLLIKYTLF